MRNIRAENQKISVASAKKGITEAAAIALHQRGNKKR